MRAFDPASLLKLLQTLPRPKRGERYFRALVLNYWDFHTFRRWLEVVDQHYTVRGVVYPLASGLYGRGRLIEFYSDLKVGIFTHADVQPGHVRWRSPSVL